jgi:hypothetical protein
MAQKDPNDKILEKIADMLVVILDHHGKPFTEKVIPPEIHQELDNLENVMALYKKITEDALMQCGVSPEEVKKRMAAPKTDLPLENQRFLERAGKLEMDLVKLEYVYGMYRQAFDMRRGKESKKGKEKKFGDARKKKFKRLGGGDKGWMPL